MKGIAFCKGRFLLMVLAVSAAVFAQEEAESTVETLFLKAVEPVKTPVIKHTTFYYYCDLKFNKAPTYFWAYYDSLHKTLNLECYDVVIKYPNKTAPRSALFKSVSVKSGPSKMSLTNTQSLITLGLERGWNFKATQENETTLSVVIWKEMNAGDLQRHSSILVWSLIVSGLLGALVITSALLFS